LGEIRLVTPDDAAGILLIYGPIVRETSISFELEVPTLEQMQERIASVSAVFPWLVDEGNGEVRGYAYASRHRERAAYQWSTDVSVYVAADARGQGIARRLYRALLSILRDLSYYSALAGIALPNDASVALHESLGFQKVGVYRSVGFKHGAWHDVGWWQLALAAYEEQPVQPRTMADFVQSPDYRKDLMSRADGN
jgi:L-amino acid N-acyltransferase YncA